MANDKDLTPKQVELLTKLFIRWVNSEMDIETLEAARANIDHRITLLKKGIDVANRVTIKGFK